MTIDDPRASWEAAQEAIFDLSLDADVSGNRDERIDRLVNFQVAAALDIKNPAIRRHREFDGVGGGAVEDDFLPR